MQFKYKFNIQQKIRKIKKIPRKTKLKIQSDKNGKMIKFNVRKELGIFSPFTGSLLEVDIWIPSLNLAFEFQVQKNFPFLKKYRNIV